MVNYVRPPSFIDLGSSSEVQVYGTVWVLLATDSDQHGHSEQSVPQQPHMQQAVVHFGWTPVYYGKQNLFVLQWLS